MEEKETKDMGIVGVIVGVGVVASVGFGVTNICMSVSAQNKAEDRVREQERKAEVEAGRAGRKNVLKAMWMAATGSTNIRLDTDIASERLDHMTRTDGQGSYVIATKDAQKSTKERVRRDARTNGNPVEGLPN